MPRDFKKAVLGGEFQVFANVTDFADITGTGVGLGFTRGLTVELEGDLRQIEVDGQLGAVKGGLREVLKQPKFTFGLMEWAQEAVLEKVLRVGKETEGDIDFYRPKGEITDADYLDNLVVVGRTTDGQAIIEVLENVLVTNTFSKAYANKDEVVLPIEAWGTYESGDSKKVPYKTGIVTPTP